MKSLTNQVITQFHANMTNGLLENHAHLIFDTISEITKNGASLVCAEHKMFSPEWTAEMNNLDNLIRELQEAYDYYID